MSAFYQAKAMAIIYSGQLLYFAYNTYTNAAMGHDWLRVREIYLLLNLKTDLLNKKLVITEFIFSAVRNSESLIIFYLSHM